MSKEDTYTGGAAIINAWNPSVELDKSTCMRLRLESMDGDDEGTRNVVQVGWMVNSLYICHIICLSISWIVINLHALIINYVYISIKC